MSYYIGVDIGGTFTDCVVLDAAGRVVTAKAPSVPDDFAQGMINAIDAAAQSLGISVEQLLEQADVVAHGTTVGTNAVIQRNGAKVGIITTKGHRDVIHIMRGSRGVSGRDIELVVHFPESHKPEPLVPKRLIETVSERVDCFGRVVVPLNRAETETAIVKLLEKKVEAIAICFLWSFLYPDHEREVRDMVQRLAPHVFVTCSADLVPKWGEYERTTAVVLNAYIGPLTAGYLRRLNSRLKNLGYRQPLQITQCGGGTISVEKAMQSPLLTLDSGPVSGVTGSAYVGRQIGCRNIITTDMGGTSFDVGIVTDGNPVNTYVSNVNQYEYFIPKVDIQVVGAGGGSLARIDEATHTLRVGPDSAGAKPGPICYGRGGKIPTVTDADLVLGYIGADTFAGGRMKLDKAAAVEGIQTLADQLGIGIYECASGICKIVEFQMADIIRKVTVGKGMDPRDFVLFAFGGAGPVHAGTFSRELGVQKVIIPQRQTASSWCAFGAATADVLHINEKVDISASPFDLDRIRRNIVALSEQSSAQLTHEGIPAERHILQSFVDMRHRGQINEVDVSLEGMNLTENFADLLSERFYARYEQLYGRGSSFAGARLESVTLRIRASAKTPRPALHAVTEVSQQLPRAATRGSRPVFWDELKALTDTPVYDGIVLVPGNTVIGPGIVETPDTTVVVRPGQICGVDVFQNFELVVRG